MALPPLIGLAALLTFAADWVTRVGHGHGLLMAGGGRAAIWAALMAGGRLAGDGRDLASLLDLAERGAPGTERRRDGLSAAQRRLADALDERNRQIAVLAGRIGAAPITGTRRQVAAQRGGHRAAGHAATRPGSWPSCALPDDASCSGRASTATNPNATPEP